MSVKQRIAHALAANAFGQAVTVGSQLLLIPLFFDRWGAGLYGEWLMLSSVPAYLTMVDLGIGSAAGNEMIMRAAAGNRAGAQQTYRGANLVAVWAGAASLLIGLLLAAMAAHWQWPRTHLIKVHDAALILLLLAAGVSLGFQGGVTSAGFRAAGNNALGITLSNLSRLAEALAMGASLLLGHGPLALCLIALLTRALMQVLQHVWLHRICPWLLHPKVPADTTLVKRLIAPSLGFLALPLGNALALQSPILIIGSSMGAPAVAMFSAMRTLARVPVQVANAVNASVWPEMSRAHGAGDQALLRQLHRGTWGITLLMVLAGGGGLTLLGPWLTHHWLGPQAPFEHTVLASLVLVTMLSATWNASAVVLSAANAHARLGFWYVLANALCMGLAWLLTPHLNWPGLLAPLVLAESLLLAWALPATLHFTQDTTAPFFKGSLQQLPQAMGHPLKR